MSEDFNNTFFYLLPSEILIKILSEINTSTLLKFCEAYECDYLLQDRNVIQTIDLQKNYDLRDFSQISKKIAFEYVTTLNVNCLYWIQAAELREFVTRLVNLETLYAFQTNLSLVSSDTEAFSKSKIKKLGVSISIDDELGNHKILTVETLYIRVVRLKTLFTPMAFEIIFPNLRKLWIDVEEICGRGNILKCLNGENKSKIFFQVNNRIPTIKFDNDDCFTTYYNEERRTHQPAMVCCEKFSAKELHSKSNFDMEGCLGSWRVVDEFQHSRPYGPKDARRLFLGENTLDNIFFDELNFYDSYPNCKQQCNQRSREAINEILRSPCAQRLKKLCIKSCALENKNARESVDIHSGFSRKRIALENSISPHPVQEVFNNFLDLEHLEIYDCFEIFISRDRSTIQAYPLISLFENLQSLMLDNVPTYLDGSFLIAVLKNCKRIERLTVSCNGSHKSFNDNLCEAISNATFLKDFRYENYHIPLDKLIERLCLVKTKKLQRIVLACKITDKFSAEPLRKFLDINPQLVFVYFVIRGYPSYKLTTMAQEILNTYKEQHPARVFYCKKEDVFYTAGYQIPDVHYWEMLRTDSDVAFLRPLEDFKTF